MSNTTEKEKKSIIFTSKYDDIKIPETPLHEFIFNKIKGFDQDKDAIIDFETKEKLKFKDLIDLSENFSQNLYQKYEVKQNETIAVKFFFN
jgi:hypothetical protein